MKGLSVAAVATASLVAVAFGGIAMASEYTVSDDEPLAVEIVGSPDPTDPVVDSEETPEPEDGDAAPTGLTCVLLPAPGEDDATSGEESTDQATAGGDAASVEEPAVAAEWILTPGAIECSRTGNERSAEVASVPRYLAHSEDISGAERGAIISAWAKTHANKKSEEGDGSDSAVEDGEADSGDDASTATGEPQAPATSPGRSGEAPGHGGSHPGNGRGR